MKITNIATAGSRCFCPGCVREVPLDNEGCPHCEWSMDYKDRRCVPPLDRLINDASPGEGNDISPRFFKFLVAYGRATHDHK